MFFPKEVPSEWNDQVEQPIVKTEPDEIHEDPVMSIEEDHDLISAHEPPIVSIEEDPLGSVKLEPLDEQVIVKREPDGEPEAKKVKKDSIIVPLFVINQKQFPCDECSALLSSKFEKNLVWKNNHD